MNYTINAGVLSIGEKPVMHIKSVFTGPEKKIISPEGTLLLQTVIRNLGASSERRGDVRFRNYMMLDAEERECANALPDYAAGDDPTVVGWPVCRTPKVDHARFFLAEQEFRLVMKNSQNYRLERMSGEIAVQVSHRGLTGGWDIEAADAFCPELICGIFVFCRYIEQENEFLTV